MGVGTGRVEDPNSWDYLCCVELKLSLSRIVFYRSVNIFMNGLDKKGKVTSYADDKSRRILNITD